MLLSRLFPIRSNYVLWMVQNRICNPSNRYKSDNVRETFEGVMDRFNGITIDTTIEKCHAQDFTGKLQDSLQKWEKELRRCIWFKVNIRDSAYVPLLAKNGFNFHHARDDFVMMFKWLPEDCKPNLPPSAHTNLGVGAMVFNKTNQLLAVSEQHLNYPHWKLPGGYVERGEDLIHAAVREVREETGINSAFHSLITIRHTHNMMFGNSDIYVLLMLNALSEQINISTREIKSCKWMDVEEYLTHPHVHDFNKLIVKKALEFKDKNIKLDLKEATVKWSTFVNNIRYLSIEFD